MARPSRLSKIPVADLNAELARRRGGAGALRRQHDRLAAEVERVRGELEALGSLNGAVPRGRRRGGRRRRAGRPGRFGPRGRNKTTLADALAAAMGSKTMGLTDLVHAVKAGGYKSKSKDLRAVVSVALVKSGRFKRVGRGRYTAK